MSAPGGQPRLSERVSARVIGIVQGREIDAEALLELEAQSLVILWTRAAPWRLALAGIDGVSQGSAQLTLYLASGDVLDLSGDDDLRVFGARLMANACAVPELTRGLHALGSLRGAPGASHDAWFAPLLSARRALEGVSDPLRQVTLLNAAQLAEAMTRVMSELAAIQAPTDAPAQRAIEAVLEESAEPMFRALSRLEVAADALRGSALDTRLADWRRWIEMVREVFTTADESWRRGVATLDFQSGSRE
jgi:hypothetical protein